MKYGLVIVYVKQLKKKTSAHPCHIINYTIQFVGAKDCKENASLYSNDQCIKIFNIQHFILFKQTACETMCKETKAS